MEDSLQPKEVRSATEVKAKFSEAGISIAEWARENRFSAGLVYHVLAGRNKASRGQSHRIAVALGMKRGSAPLMLGFHDNLTGRQSAEGGV